MLSLFYGASGSVKEAKEVLLARLLRQVKLRHHVVRVLDRVVKSPVAEEHKLEFHFLLDVANVAALTRQVELEQVKVVSISNSSAPIALGSLIGHMQLHFFLALLGFEVLLLEVDLLVQDLVSEANDAPPENVTRHFVELLGEFVENCRAALAEEVSSVIVDKLYLFLPLQSSEVHLICTLVLSLISGTFVPSKHAVRAFSHLTSAFLRLSVSVDSFIITPLEILQFSLGFLHLVVLFDGSAGFVNSNRFVIVVVQRTFFLLSCSEIFSLLFLIDDSFLLKNGLIVAAILLVFIQVVVFVVKIEQVLVKLSILQAGTLEEGLAAVVDHDQFLGLVVDRHVVDWPVRVNNVRLHVVLPLVKPFLGEVETATAVDKDET